MMYQNMISKPVYCLLIILSCLPQFALQAQVAPALDEHIELLNHYISANDTCFGRLATNGLEALGTVDQYEVQDFENRIEAYDNAARFFRAARVCLQNDRIQSLLANRLLEDILALRAREEREMELSKALDIISLLGNTPTAGTKKIVYENVLSILQQLQHKQENPQDDASSETPAGPNKETLRKLIKYTLGILQALPSTDIKSLQLKLADTTGFNSQLTAEVVQQVETAASIQFFQDHRASVRNLVFTENGNYLMSRARDSTVSIRMADAPETEAIQFKHRAFVHDAVWYDHGKAVVTVGSDGTALRWDLETQQATPLFQDSTGALLAVAANAEGQLLLGSRSGMVHFISPEDTLTVNHGWPVYAVAFSPDGKGFLSHSPQGFKVWDEQKKLLYQQEWSEKLVYHTHFAPSIDRVVTSGTDSLVQLWDFERSSNPQRVPIWRNQNPVPTLQLVQSKLLLAADEQDSVRVWQLNNSVPDILLQLAIPEKIEAAAAVSLPGNHLLVIAADEKGQLHFNRDSGQTTSLKLSLSNAKINTLSIHSSGRFFAAGLNDGRIITGKIPGIVREQ